MDRATELSSPALIDDVEEFAHHVGNDPEESAEAVASVGAVKGVPVERCGICDRRLKSTKIRAKDLFLPEGHPLAVEYEIRSCRRCRAGWTNPQLSDAELAPHYANDYYARLYNRADEDVDASKVAQLLGRLRARLASFAQERRWTKAPFSHVLSRRPGRLLDVGCGGGDLLAAFQDRGWTVTGIDPTKEAVEHVQEAGMDAEIADVFSHQPSERYDLVTMQHVLEHLPNPVEQLRRTRELVTPGGQLLVIVPNWSSWQRSLWKGRWWGLDLPRHQQHFSKRALRRAAMKSGWRPVLTGRGSIAATTIYTMAFAMWGEWPSGWRLLLSYVLAAPVWAVLRLLNDDYCWMLAESMETDAGHAQAAAE